MSEDKRIKNPSSEIKDEELDQVSGGRGPVYYYGNKPCPNGCGRLVPLNWEGPCPVCSGQPLGPQSMDDI